MALQVQWPLFRVTDVERVCVQPFQKMLIARLQSKQFERSGKTVELPLVEALEPNSATV
jgi:hypothetical protein